MNNYEKKLLELAGMVAEYLDACTRGDITPSQYVMSPEGESIYDMIGAEAISPSDCERVLSEAITIASGWQNGHLDSVYVPTQFLSEGPESEMYFEKASN